MVLHTGCVGLKVMDGGANHLVWVMALVQRLEGSDNFADFPLFQEVAHTLEPSLLSLWLLYPHFGRRHEFLDGMCPVHNFHNMERFQS